MSQLLQLRKIWVLSADSLPSDLGTFRRPSSFRSGYFPPTLFLQIWVLSADSLPSDLGTFRRLSSIRSGYFPPTILHQIWVLSAHSLPSDLGTFRPLCLSRNDGMQAENNFRPFRGSSSIGFPCPKFHRIPSISWICSSLPSHRVSAH